MAVVIDQTECEACGGCVWLPVPWWSTLAKIRQFPSRPRHRGPGYDNPTLRADGPRR